MINREPMVTRRTHCIWTRLLLDLKHMARATQEHQGFLKALGIDTWDPTWSVQGCDVGVTMGVERRSQNTTLRER